MSFILTKRGTQPLALDLTKISYIISSQHVDNATEVHMDGGAIFVVSLPFGMFISKLQEAGLLEKE